MCGLIAFISNSNKNQQAGRHIVEQYQDQLGRGTEGFGLIEVFENGIDIHRAVEPIKALMDARLTKSSIPIFHHRYPTATENIMSQTHPFMVEHEELEYDYCVTHNGVLKNEADLFKLHTEQLGYIYSTLREVKKDYSSTSYYAKKNKPFNDSESLAIEVARYFDGNIKEIGATGTIAFIAIKINKKTKKPVEMIWGRNDGNPLEVLNKKEGILLASCIDHVEAETITSFTFETLDLIHHFKTKKKYELFKQISAKPLKFYTPPEIPKTLQKTGFGAKSVAPSTTPAVEEQNIEETEYLPEALTPREKAFKKMGERVKSEMNHFIEVFFADLAYSDVDDENAMLVANSLNELILEKVEVSRDRVRPHFDEREELEMEEIVENEINIEDDVYEEELIEERAKTLQERIEEASIKQNVSI